MNKRGVRYLQDDLKRILSLFVSGGNGIKGSRRVYINNGKQKIFIWDRLLD